MLQSKAMVGVISPHIGNLSFLRTLNLMNNSFQGEIPQELGRMFRIENMYLSNNSLRGEIPVNISHCSNLLHLYLPYNNLVGKIPMEFGSLTKLVVISIHQNQLTGEIPSSLGNITSLQSISCGTNSLSGSIPSTLAHLKNFKNLGVGDNNLSGMFPLYNLSTLEIISFSLNRITGILPSGIGDMLPNLRLFYIAANQISGVIPASLFNASKLQRVSISVNWFIGKFPTTVGNLKQLTGLAINSNDLGNGEPEDLDFITSLTNCSNLQVLDISSNNFGGPLSTSVTNLSDQLTIFYSEENQIFGNIPFEIHNLRNLNLLDFSGNSINGGIPKSIGSLQNLKNLDLSSNRLSGHLPLSIKNMSQLFQLDLSNNLLQGSIGSSIDNQVLQTLDLSYNKFTGAIPTSFYISSRLINLTLSHNSLNGSIPLEVGNLKSLQYLDVSDNKISGEIPRTLAACTSLEYLNFRGNFFNGSIPSSLSSLKGIREIDISRNNLSGNIPKEMVKLLGLQSLNLSFNDLDGEIPTDGIFRNASAFSANGNEKLCGGILVLGLRKCQNQKPNKRETHLALIIALSMLVPSSIIVLFFALYFSRRKPKREVLQLFVGDLKRVSYNDLFKATDGFSSTNLIGVGKHGSVYKGILRDDTLIAIKVFNLMERGASKSFINECEALREARHRNVLKILTVCSSVDFHGNDFVALVFMLMSNGSLESWLHPNIDGQPPRRSLSLQQKLNIAINIASALDYLHNQCERCIVHCDLKPSNVLLGNDLRAFVGDFGIAKFLSKTENTKEYTSVAIRGTIGYIPPEYGMGAEVSTEGDVYSYGILLLEIFTGKRPTDLMFKDGLSLHEFCKMALTHRVLDIVDMRIFSKEIHEEAANVIDQMEDCLSALIRVGVACSQEVMTERMDIKDALKELHGIRTKYP